MAAPHRSSPNRDRMYSAASNGGTRRMDGMSRPSRLRRFHGRPRRGLMFGRKRLAQTSEHQNQAKHRRKTSPAEIRHSLSL
ncbi:hypothetical protein GRAN_2906 [Granulicella sibirica]|uniref:Uncharacterized protein n=1 Tax=Granulicella sibirica TaxID=2479048 RepID=A0A4Q0T2A6_9BACT|nr:hypothetical protein GRAN_2906 [Granulicella sibirica]